jgi:thymidylate synthase (FAD)
MEATSSVRLIATTQAPNGENTAERMVAYVARVSNPSNQANNETAPRLLKYLIDHQHWSPFELVSMVVHIRTSRAIAQQILRHRSFSFQEFSQRYAEAAEFIKYPARRQDKKNRQNSIDDMPQGVKFWFDETQQNMNEWALQKYKEAIGFGIAKEQARFLLPLSTQTSLYMAGTARSWIHYIQLRTDPATQLEHREIAEGCKAIFCQQFPDTSEALGWRISIPETGSAK